MENYTRKELYQILLKKSELRGIIEDWDERNIQCDLCIRRAKTNGHVVVETRDVMFANNIQRWHPGCKVNIKQE